MTRSSWGLDTDRPDRLAEIADEWRHRLRTEDPKDNQRWLHANTSPEDREDLLYVLGAAVPDDRPWVSLTAWIVPRPDPQHVDEIAVERACKGEQLPLSRAERDAAIVWCKRRGLTDVATARLLRIAPRTVAVVARNQRCAQSVDNLVGVA
jgi:hypothetical protein